jgi:hypothetical protein
MTGGLGIDGDDTPAWRDVNVHQTPQDFLED